MLIAQISDLHMLPPGQIASGVVETNVLVERAVNALLRLNPRPDIVVITGDVTECGLEEEYASIVQLLDRLPMPVYAIPGNHDRREAFRAAFASRGYLPDAGPLDFVIESRPVRIVGLDTVVPGHGHGELRRESLEFLDRTLAEAPAAPTLVMLHHPPFDCGIRHMDRIRLLKGAEEIAEIVKRNSQVERVVTGHHHRPIQFRFAGTICQVAPSVAHQVALDLSEESSACFVLEPPAFLLHHWADSGGLVTHTAYVDRSPGPFPFVLPDDYPGKS